MVWKAARLLVMAVAGCLFFTAAWADVGWSTRVAGLLVELARGDKAYKVLVRNGSPDDVRAAIKEAMEEHDFTLDREEDDVLLFTKKYGLSRYDVVYRISSVQSGTEATVAESMPRSIIFFDPGILGRTYRTPTYIKPILDSVKDRFDRIEPQPPKTGIFLGSSDAGGYIISSVVQGSPADDAGLKDRRLGDGGRRRAFGGPHARCGEVFSRGRAWETLDPPYSSQRGREPRSVAVYERARAGHSVRFSCRKRPRARKCSMVSGRSEWL